MLGESPRIRATEGLSSIRERCGCDFCMSRNLRPLDSGSYRVITYSKLLVHSLRLCGMRPETLRIDVFVRHDFLVAITRELGLKLGSAVRIVRVGIF